MTGFENLRTALNRTMKKLLIEHAFAQGFRRIEFRVDARNQRSQATVLKLGATHKGVLRNHMITWIGHDRDSAVFSVVERDRERF
jgi:RimJ/RimL family protein N-acetyltransferase